MSVRVWAHDESIVPFLYMQKCASTSIEEALRKKHGHGKPVPLRDYDGPLACMWRDPGERLESAYRMFRERPEMGKTRDHAVPRADHMDFEEWAWGVLEKHDATRDLHVASQYRQATVDGRFKPTVIFKWDFAALGDAYGVTLDRRNVSSHAPTVWSPELILAHATHYEADWLVWLL